MSPPYKGSFVYRGAFSLVDREERSDAVAQPFATKERYGCGVPLAGIAGTISCRNYRLRTNLFVYTVCRFAVLGDTSRVYREFYGNAKKTALSCMIVIRNRIIPVVGIRPVSKPNAAAVDVVAEQIRPMSGGIDPGVMCADAAVIARTQVFRAVTIEHAVFL